MAQPIYNWFTKVISTFPPPCNLPSNVVTVPPTGGGGGQSDGSPPGGEGVAPQNCTIVSQCQSALAPCKNFLWCLRRLIFSLPFEQSDAPGGGDCKRGGGGIELCRHCPNSVPLSSSVIRCTFALYRHVPPPHAQEPAMFDRGTSGRFLHTLSPKKFDRGTKGWFLRMTVGSPVPPKKFFRLLCQGMRALSFPTVNHIDK